ncbi:hypothetical protein [Chromohalobacter israelensis]|uniref:hypothetical protein n=1 Tax=Chromohalobacter israelensis TaxID=141390 RepID=UPI000FFE75B8|nr:hypothetical protein [Chromohalobacter salexigens]RXE48809.1 hypothetical protein B4O83_12870 [Chromohalobacter salexigens]
MSYLVFCTFDLESASSRDYDTAYSDLAELGLNKVQVAGNGNEVVIPTTSVMGTFNGSGAGSVRDDIRSRVKRAFQSRGFTSEIFVIVGGDWAWGATTT